MEMNMPDPMPVGTKLQIRMEPTHTQPFIMAGYDEKNSVMALQSLFGELVMGGKALLVRYVSIGTWEAFKASGFSHEYFRREIEANLGPPEEGGYEYTFARNGGSR